jgi:nucleotide-binding universal stress UspA family protein
MSADNRRGPVLLCWDGSDAARRAIASAGEVFDPGRTAVVFSAYVPTESARGVLGGLSGPDAPIMGPTDAEDLMAQGVTAASQAGFDATARLVVAEERTSKLIVAEAEARDCLMIVMGQRERSALGTLFLGSVAREVLEAMHRPVMLVGPGGGAPYPRR